jgi:hypothetical protein
VSSLAGLGDWDEREQLIGDALHASSENLRVIQPVQQMIAPGKGSLSGSLASLGAAVPIYGSGDFTSYDDRRLARWLAGWVEKDGCQWVKMKIGSEPDRDPAAIGAAALFVDASGAHSVRRAQHFAEMFAADQDVRWFEEPVPSDNLDGLRHVRAAAPATTEIAAWEYGYTSDYFHRMLGSGAVDGQQAHATRRGGVTASCEPRRSLLELSRMRGDGSFIDIHAAAMDPRRRPNVIEAPEPEFGRHDDDLLLHLRGYFAGSPVGGGDLRSLG